MRGCCVNYGLDLKKILESRVEMVTFGSILKEVWQGGAILVIMGYIHMGRGI